MKYLTKQLVVNVFKARVLLDRLIEEGALDDAGNPTHARLLQIVREFDLVTENINNTARFGGTAWFAIAEEQIANIRVLIKRVDL